MENRRTLKIIKVKRPINERKSSLITKTQYNELKPIGIITSFEKRKLNLFKQDSRL